MAKGIIIDVGFKADVKNFVDKLQSDLKKVDYSDAVGLSEEFSKQKKEIENQLKELKIVIDETINGKIPNDPNKQLQALNKAVIILSSSMKDMMASMSGNESNKFASQIGDITNTVNELTGVCKNASDAISEINNEGNNIQFVDSNSIKAQMLEIENLYKTLRNLISEVDDIDIAPVDKRYKNAESVFKELVNMYRRMDEAQAKYSDATFGNDSEEIYKTAKAYLECANSVARLVSTYEKLGGSFDEEIDLGDFSIPVNEIRDNISVDFNELKKVIANKINEINILYQSIGGENLDTKFSKSIRKDESNQITIPLGISTSSGELVKQALSIINLTQKKLEGQPLKVELMLVSEWKSKRNSKRLKEIQDQLTNIDDEEVKSKILKLTDDIQNTIDDALTLDVKINTKSAYIEVRKFIKDIEEELKSLNEQLIPLEPEVVLTDEHREAFQKQLDEAKGDFKINVGIMDGDDTVDNNATKKELSYLKFLQQQVEKVTKAVNDKSDAFKEEEKIVRDSVNGELRNLNNIYLALVSIKECISELKDAFNSIPEEVNIKFNIESLNDLLSNNDLINKLKNTSDIIQSAIAYKSEKSVSIQNEQKELILSDVKEISNKIDDMFTTNKMNEWTSSFINSLNKISQKIQSLFGDNALTDMIKEWSFSDEMMKKESEERKWSGSDSEIELRERSAVIGSDGKIYGSYAYDQPGSTDFLSRTIDKIPLGVLPKIGIHSHGGDRIVASSVPQGENSSGDLTAFYYEYIYKQIEKQLTIALNDIEVFDAKGFYDSNSKINFDDKKIRDKIKNKKDEICEEISENFYKYFEEFVGKYGSIDKENIKNLFINDTDLLDIPSGTGIKDAIMEKIDPEKLVKNLFSNLKLNKGLNLSLTDAFKKSIDFSSIDYKSLGYSKDEVNNVYTQIISNIYNYAKSIIDNMFNLDSFDYDMGGRDLFTFNFRKETPHILSEALQGTGYKNNYQDYMKTYTIEEFLEQNPLGLSSSTLSDMFNNSAPTEFLGTLDKIVDDLTAIKNAASNNELKDMFNIKFDEASLKEMTSVIDSLIFKLEEISSLFNGKSVSEQLKLKLKDFVSLNKQLNDIANNNGNEDEWIKINDELNSKFNTEFWGATEGFDLNSITDNNINEYVNKMIEKIKELGISFEDLGVKEEGITNPIDKINNNFENLLVSIKNLIESLSKLPELFTKSLSNPELEHIEENTPDKSINISSDISETFSKEKQVVDQVIDSEIKSLNKLEKKLAKVTKAVDTKTKAFEKEGKIVQDVAEEEISSLNPLQSLESAYKNFKPFYDNEDLESEAGANAALAYYTAYREALMSKVNKKDLKQFTIGKMDDLFTGNYTDFKNGTGELDLSGLTSQIEKYQEIVDKLNQPEIINVINALSEAIKQLLDSGNTSDKTTSLLEALNKVINNLSNNKSADKIQKISDNLINFQKSLQILNSTDNNGFVQMLSSILEKGNELKALGEVLKATEKQIQAAKKSVNEQNNYDKASKYMIDNENNIRNDINQKYGVNGNEVLYSTLSATKEGLVQVVTLVKQADETYKKYTSTVDTNGKIQEKTINTNIMQLSKEAKQWEIFKKLQESIIPGATNLGIEGESFTPDSAGWDRLVAKAAEFGIEVKDIEKIIRNVDEVGHESFQIFTKLSRITVGVDSKGVLFQKDDVLDTKVIDEFKKEISTLPNLLNNAFKGNATSTNMFIDLLESIRTKWIQINKLSKNGLIDKSDVAASLNYLEAFKQTLSNISIENIDLSDKSPKFIEQYKQAETYLNELVFVFDKIEASQPFTDEDFNKLKQFISQVELLFNTINDKDSKLAKDTAVNKTLSKLYDVLKNNSSMSKELRNEFNQLAADIKNFGGDIPADKMEEFNSRFMKLSAQMKETGQVGKSFFDMITSRIKGMSATMIAQYFSFYDIVRYIRQLISYVTELDTAMVELRKVTNATKEQYASFQNTIAQNTKKVASTNSDLISSAADWARLGYNIEQASDLAKNSAMFVNVGDGIDIDTATEDMISAMKAFNIEAEDSMRIVDAYNEVGNNFAISAGGIGEAMQRSASALSTANNSFEESIALITAMNEVLQDTETTGTTLKVLSLRLRGASTEIEDMGESTDGMADSTSKLQEKIAALTNTDGKGGINILTDTGDFKSTYEIIKSIASKWQDISDINQAALLELIAGKTRANGVSALLNNWEQLDKVVKSASNSDESAEKENESVINSIEGKIKILKASTEELSNDFIKSDVVKGFVNAGITIINILDKIIKKLKSLGTILVAVGISFAAFKIKQNGGGRVKCLPSYIICLQCVA